MAKKSGHKGIYIDPLTDFGFKRIFGNKALLIDFLNEVLNINGGIADLTYAPTIRTGLSKDDRTAIFDLYCTTGTGEHIVVEMQTVFHKNYKQRTIFYLARLIQEQAKRGKNWDFSMPAIYQIIIVNFEIDKELKKENFLSRIKFMYEDINKPYYDDATIVYLELPLFKKKINQLKTNIDRWMYALKFLPKLNRLPKALQKEIFEKLFELAKIAKMTKKQQTAYYKSLEEMSIVKHTVDYLKHTVDHLQDTITELQNSNVALQSNNVAQAKELDEYRRRYGALNSAPARNSAAKPRTAKVRARNSAKTKQITEK